MKVGVFSVIDWSFLDQRPQVLAKKLGQWGHDVVYFEPFFKFEQWNDTYSHPWAEYEAHCWKLRNVYPGVNAVTMMCPPAHKSLGTVVDKNADYRERNIAFVKTLNLDLAIVIDPAWGPLLDELGVPYIYDHVDDTHQMEAVIKNHWIEAQKHCEKNAIAVMYIQPNIARRYEGLYVPNGMEPSQLDINATPEKYFDSGCLSAIADWFDLESVLYSKKKLLIIGPMDQSVRTQYENYRKTGETNVTWIPRVSRRVGVHWLKRCKTAMVPFRDDHAIVDYVMPLKLVEYLYLGLPSISYLNKGIEEEFGELVQFYSCFNWRGLPSLDEAIELATSKPENSRVYRELALKFTWDRVCRPLEKLVHDLDIAQSTSKSFRNISRVFVKARAIIPLSQENTNEHRDIKWFYEAPHNSSSDLELPPYLELYYQLFRDSFLAENEEGRRYVYLCWLLSEQQEGFELIRAKQDNYILDLLGQPHDDVELFGGDVVLSNFHYYFFQRNKASFKAWGISLDSVQGKQAFLIWCYTWGIEKCNYFYLKNTRQKYLETSNIFNLGFFDITKIFEMMIQHELSNYLIDHLIHAEELKLQISRILFQYGQYRYPLTENQIVQLLEQFQGKLVFAQFWHSYKLAYLTKEHDEVSVASMDIHPALKQQLLSCGADKALQSLVPQYLEPLYRTFHDAKLQASDEDQQYGFLCWLLSARQEGVELVRARQDTYILDLLGQPHDDDELFGGDVVLSNFHYYFFQLNKTTFKAWEFSLDTVQGKQAFLIWCYTWGIEKGNYFYLTHTKNRFLENSAIYSLHFFDVTKIFEMIIDLEGLADLSNSSIFSMQLEIQVSRLLFHYAQYRYPLTENQIAQMLAQYHGNLVFAKLWLVYRKAFITHNNEVSVADMDIHPGLKQRLLSEVNNLLITRFNEYIQ